MANYLIEKKSNLSNDATSKYETFSKGMNSVINSAPLSNNNGIIPGNTNIVQSSNTTTTTTTTSTTTTTTTVA